MAVIKAVSSKAGIGHAIDYVTKKEKTEEKLVSGLGLFPRPHGRIAHNAYRFFRPSCPTAPLWLAFLT